ncbi:MAG: LysR family transcriptional regulator, partial [Pseudomonadota bacterium]
MFRLLTLVFAITLTAPAAAEPVSSIRQAAIERLEQKLGVRLLERSTRSLRVTEVGREFFERSVSVLTA